MADTKPLPTWADSWVKGRCGCGARLCRVDCYCSGHVVCSASGRDIEKCQLLDSTPEHPDVIDVEDIDSTPEPKQ